MFRDPFRGEIPEVKILNSLLQMSFNSAYETKPATNENDSRCCMKIKGFFSRKFSFSIIIFVKTFKVKTSKMTHFAGENWNGNHLPNSSAVYNSSEVPFPQIWNQEGAAAYNEIIGFQDLGAKKIDTKI